MSASLAAALSYAERGWPVVACHHPLESGRCSCGNAACEDIGKHPRYHGRDLPHGLHSATTNSALITRWWRRWPAANVAIVTGEKSQLLVLDSDTGGYVLPPTLTARTGRGRHAYFHLPPGAALRNRIGLLPGLDVRANNGMIIAPPSRHAMGLAYRWEATRSLLPPPAWLLALLAPPAHTSSTIDTRPQSSQQRRNGNSEIRRGPTYAACALAAELASLRITNPGTRNRTLNWIAFRAGQFLAAGYLDEAVTTDSLTAAGLRAGLQPSEIAKTIASGLAAGKRSSRL